LRLRRALDNSTPAPAAAVARRRLNNPNYLNAITPNNPFFPFCGPAVK